MDTDYLRCLFYAVGTLATMAWLLSDHTGVSLTGATVACLCALGLWHVGGG